MIGLAPPLQRARSFPLRLATVAALVTVLLCAGTFARAAAEQEIIPFDEVQTGMTGYGRTVFSGRQVESFDVEVIGKLENIAPRRNVILARLTGGPLAQTGVLEGMSGSPVYLADGKLAGAVAYSWSFSKEPICGITPIEEMLDLLTRQGNKAEGGDASADRMAPGAIDMLWKPAAVPAFLRHRLESLAAPMLTGGLAPLPIPTGFSGGARPGAAGREIDRWESLLTTMGLAPVSAGSDADSKKEPEPPPIEPGAAMGVQLVRGDLEMAAVGTVTWVHGDRFLAMGHNFLAIGPTALPATRAEVFGYLPSLASSFKLATSSTPLGVVTQDRFGGLAGTTKGAAPMVPINVTLRSTPERESHFSFEVVDDPLLTPILMHLSFLQIFQTAEKAAGDITLSVRKGSRIRLGGDLDVNLQNLYSGDQSEIIASATVAYMTYLLMNNPDRASHVAGVDLDLEYKDALSLAVIDRMWCDHYTAAPGETLPLHVSIKPYRGDAFVETIPLEIPEEAEEGKVILQVGDAATLSRMEYRAGGVSMQPRNLEQLVFLLNRIRTNNKIYATLIRPDNGLYIAGERLPNLPPSLSTVLISPGRDEAGAQRVRLRGILEEERETKYALRGYQKAILEIKR